MVIDFSKVAKAILKVGSTLLAAFIIWKALYYQSNSDAIELSNYKKAIEESLSKVSEDKLKGRESVEACISGVAVRGVPDYAILWQGVDSEGIPKRCEGTNIDKMKALGITYVKLICDSNVKMLDIIIFSYKSEHKWRFSTREKCEQNNSN